MTERGLWIDLKKIKETGTFGIVVLEDDRLSTVFKTLEAQGYTWKERATRKPPAFRWHLTSKGLDLFSDLELAMARLAEQTRRDRARSLRGR